MPPSLFNGVLPLLFSPPSSFSLPSSPSFLSFLMVFVFVLGSYRNFETRMVSMKIFVNKFLLSKEPSFSLREAAHGTEKGKRKDKEEEKAQLERYPLFDQIPKLSEDITVSPFVLGLASNGVLQRFSACLLLPSLPPFLSFCLSFSFPFPSPSSSLPLSNVIPLYYF